MLRGLWYKFNNIALETFWYIKGMCCKFTYYFAVTDRVYAFLFKSNAVGSIWSLMKIFYSSSCRRSLSVISFCSNINKKYISLRLCTLVVSLSMKLLLTFCSASGSTKIYLRENSEWIFLNIQGIIVRDGIMDVFPTTKAVNCEITIVKYVF